MYNGITIESGGVRGVTAIECEAFVEYLRGVDIDTLCEGSGFTMLKDGTTTTVGILDCRRFGMDFNVVIKRFNYRGFFDALIKKIFGSRAKRLYLKSTQLSKLGVDVPEALAFIEGRDGKRSFFISRYMEGYDNMATLFCEGALDKDVSASLMRSVAEAIAKLHVAGVTHGDMKWSNILIDRREEPFKVIFVDNDQALIKEGISNSDIVEDLVRFYRYGLELKRELFVSDEFFETYTQGILEKIDTQGLQGSVVSKAKDEFSRKN